MSSCCTICLSPSSAVTFYFTCSHLFCFLCFTRIAFLQKKCDCLICGVKSSVYCKIDESNKYIKNESNKNIINFTNKIFSNYKLNLPLYITATIYNFITDLLVFKCTICFLSFKSQTELIKHIKLHNKFTCTVCINNLYLFPFEYPLFSADKLVKHLNGINMTISGVELCKSEIMDFKVRFKSNKNIENKTEVMGHPKCKFCEINFFDETYLKTHLNEMHFKCKFCMKNGDYKYFKCVEKLKMHLDTMHIFLWCCTKPKVSLNDEISTNFKTLLNGNNNSFSNIKGSNLSHSNSNKSRIYLNETGSLKIITPASHIQDSSLFFQDKNISHTDKNHASNRPLAYNINETSPINISSHTNYVASPIEFISHNLTVHNKKISLNIQEYYNKKEIVEYADPYYLRNPNTTVSKNLKTYNNIQNISNNINTRHLNKPLLKHDTKPSETGNQTHSNINNTVDNKDSTPLIDPTINRSNTLNLNISIPLKTEARLETLKLITSHVLQYKNSIISFNELLDILKVIIRDGEIINLLTTYRSLFDELETEKKYLDVIEKLKFPPFVTKATTSTVGSIYNINTNYNKNTKYNKNNTVGETKNKVVYKYIDLSKK
ncbi:E3 ubiquitin-protein ligase hel2 [Cucumispora dikerogammari]|nr:E3 ubiquitin-protein ligase hel2 [Cucumispora dikerogammari]